MLESMTEPSEQTVGSANSINVLHLHRPLEWVAPAYGGGQVQITMIEEWTNTPYETLGFSNAVEFLDVINHDEFGITAIVYAPNGTKAKTILTGCRVLGPIIPTGAYARQTTTRTVTATVGYTRLTRENS